MYDQLKLFIDKINALNNYYKNNVRIKMLERMEVLVFYTNVKRSLKRWGVEFQDKQGKFEFSVYVFLENGKRKRSVEFSTFQNMLEPVQSIRSKLNAGYVVKDIKLSLIGVSRAQELMERATQLKWEVE